MNSEPTTKNCSADWKEIFKIVIISSAAGIAAGTALAMWLF
jgi:hypothetical protein